MAYSTLGWQNGQAPAINAENLNHMDQGIADADAAATAAATIAGQASAAVEGKVSKQTTTSTTKRVYAYDNTGDTNVVISADNANGGTIVQRTSAGQIVCNDPNAAGQAATKGYVDDRVQANPTDAATADLTKLKVGSTTYNIPSGGGSAGVSSIGGATGAISLGTGMSMNGQTLNGPDTSSFLQKKTATGTSQYVYGFTGSTQNNLQVSYAAITGSSIVSRNSGRIKCGAPDGTDNNHVVTLGYANNNYAPKATNGYAELDANGAVQGLKDVFVDFGGKALGTNTLTEGQKLYSSLSTYGFSFIANVRDFDNTHDINPQIVVSKGTGAHDGILFTYTYINNTTISIDDFDYEVLSGGDISREQV